MTTLTPHQDDARKTVVARLKGALTPEPLTYLAGFAGTGKSTILPLILESLGYQPENISFMAPTGKAAKVMRQKLKLAGYPNTNATTIHSAIYRARPPPVAMLEDDIVNHEEKLAQIIEEIRRDAYARDPDSSAEINLKLFPEIETQRKLLKRLRAELDNAYDEDKITFSLNPDAAVQLSQLIVVDEASMVGRTMAADLMDFGVPILAIGDPGQLPPVEDEPGLTCGEPDFFLREIHRQAEGNPIIHLATLARQGKDLPYGDYGNGVVVMERRAYDYTGTFEDRPQFIVGMNKTRWKITQMLRRDFGFAGDGKEMIGPRMSEPLIIKKNTRDYPNLVNGTECVALNDFDLQHGNATGRMSFEDDEGARYLDKNCFQGKFEEHFTRKAGSYTAPKRYTFRAIKSSLVLDWSYVMTAHSAQGSQFDDVVVIDESCVFREDANKHLYTAITRAAETLTVLR